MTPAEVYEKLARETGSQILGQLYRERAAALRPKEETRDEQTK